MYTADDLILWMRCRRQFQEKSAPDAVRLYSAREEERVKWIGLSARRLDILLDPPDDDRSPDEVIDRTRSCLARKSSVGRGILDAGGVAVPVDSMEFSSRSEGWNCTLYRAANGVRGVYHLEAALVTLAMIRNELPIAGIYLRFLDKEYVRADALEPGALFRESNLTKRAGKLVDQVRDGMETLLSDEPVPDDYRCAQACRLCEPKPNLDRYNVLTLHKGIDLGRKLMDNGISDIREIPPETRLSAGQKVQIEAVRTGEVIVQERGLGRFLDAVEFPAYFLDFEAFSSSIPPFPGLKPYEHTPSIASIHVSDSFEAPVRHHTFALATEKDARAEFFRWITGIIGERGSIVVFNRNFESAMLRQLGRAAGEDATAEVIIRRIVDLMTPFQSFFVYHPDQRGKISLKRLLPAYTGTGYAAGTVSDGMEANLSFTRLFDQYVSRRTGPEAEAALRAEQCGKKIEPGVAPDSLEQIVNYCATDSMGMVHLLRALVRLHERSREPVVN